MPGTLRAVCGTLLCPGQALHGQLHISGAAEPAQECQPVLRYCGVVEEEHQLQLGKRWLLLASAGPASMSVSVHTCTWHVLPSLHTKCRSGRCKDGHQEGGPAAASGRGCWMNPQSKKQVLSAVKFCTMAETKQMDPSMTVLSLSQHPQGAIRCKVL